MRRTLVRLLTVDGGAEKALDIGRKRVWEEVGPRQVVDNRSIAALRLREFDTHSASQKEKNRRKFDERLAVQEVNIVSSKRRSRAELQDAYKEAVSQLLPLLAELRKREFSTFDMVERLAALIDTNENCDVGGLHDVYCAMLDHCCLLDNGEKEAMGLLATLMHRGFTPTPRMYNCLLAAIPVGSNNRETVLGLMKEAKLCPTTGTYAVLMRGMSPEEAEQKFAEGQRALGKRIMMLRGSCMYRELAFVYAQKGDVRNLLKVIQRYEDARCESVHDYARILAYVGLGAKRAVRDGFPSGFEQDELLEVVKVTLHVDWEARFGLDKKRLARRLIVSLSSDLLFIYRLLGEGYEGREEDLMAQAALRLSNQDVNRVGREVAGMPRKAPLGTQRVKRPFAHEAWRS
eukprot:Rhum_TRINITY_DN7705_c0_g1::Rhum_TRINITY_DN7705_c0_g1_i1::g.24348::m.24348